MSKKKRAVGLKDGGTPPIYGSADKPAHPHQHQAERSYSCLYANLDVSAKGRRFENQNQYWLEAIAHFRARVYRTRTIAYFSSRILPSSRSSWCSTKRRAHGTQLAEMRDELKAEREARGAAHVELRGGIDHRPRRTRWCRTGNATPMHQFRMRNVQPRPSAASHQPLEV